MAGTTGAKRPQTEAEKATFAKGRALGRETVARNRAAKKAAEADSEAHVLESLLAALPPPPEDVSSQEMIFARLTAREQVFCDRLSAGLEFNRQHSRANGQKLTEALKSVRHLTELHMALQQASEARVNAVKAGRNGQPVVLPQTAERAEAVTRILVLAGAGSAKSDTQRQAAALAEALDKEAKEQKAIAAEFAAIPTTPAPTPNQEAP